MKRYGKILALILATILVTAAPAFTGERLFKPLSQVLSDLRLERHIAGGGDPEETPEATLDNSYGLIVYASGDGDVNTVAHDLEGRPILTGMSVNVLLSRLQIQNADLSKFAENILNNANNEEPDLPEWMDSDFWLTGFDENGIKSIPGVNGDKIYVDDNHNVWFRDTNHSNNLAKISPDGEITYWAGTDLNQILGEDSFGNLWFTKQNDLTSIWRVDAEGGLSSRSVNLRFPSLDESTGYMSGFGLGQQQGAWQLYLVTINPVSGSQLSSEEIYRGKGTPPLMLTVSNNGYTWVMRGDGSMKVTRPDNSASFFSAGMTLFGSFNAGDDITDRAPKVDSSGNIWARPTGSNYCLTRISPNGVINSWNETQVNFITIDPSGTGDIWFKDVNHNGELARFSAADGTISYDWPDIVPESLGVDTDGNIWYKDGETNTLNIFCPPHRNN